jgi:hypothetical protein
MRQLSMIRLSGPYDPNIGTELGARIRPSIVPLLPARLLYCRGNDAAEGVPSNARRGPEQPAIFSDRARGRFFCRSRRCVAPCSYFGVYKGAGSAAANSRCRCTLSGAGLGGFNRRCSGQGWCSGTLSRSVGWRWTAGGRAVLLSRRLCALLCDLSQSAATITLRSRPLPCSW